MFCSARLGSAGQRSLEEKGDQSTPPHRSSSSLFPPPPPSCPAPAGLSLGFTELQIPRAIGDCFSFMKREPLCSLVAVFSGNSPTQSGLRYEFITNTLRSQAAVWAPVCGKWTRERNKEGQLPWRPASGPHPTITGRLTGNLGEGQVEWVLPPALASWQRLSRSGGRV